MVLVATVCLKLISVISFVIRARNSNIHNVYSLDAVTPIGPFCPFRSESAMELDPKMEAITSVAPDFGTEVARIQLDLKMGHVPDPNRLQKVARGIEVTVDNWEELLEKLNDSRDFQTREYAKFTQAHLGKFGQTSEEICSMMRWQSKCMFAMAQNRPPPFPPSGLNVMKMMDAAKATGGKPAPSLARMSTAVKVTERPFEEDKTFQSEIVRNEYLNLCRDHAYLIKFGSRYSSFDPPGKIAFLDKMDEIHDRWDIFFSRFDLMGQLNETFIKQCDRFLESMNMTEEDFKQLMKETHSIMRNDAENERSKIAK